MTNGTIIKLVFIIVFVANLLATIATTKNIADKKHIATLGKYTIFRISPKPRNCVADISIK